MTDPMTQEQYVFHHGCLCPVCRSEDTEVEMDFSESDLYVVVQESTCHECGASWQALYTLTGYQRLEHGEEEAHA
jgi:transposase-like protein